MPDDSPCIVVTPPPICNSSELRNLIKKHFPNVQFNEQGKYFTEDELIQAARNADGLLVGRDPVTPRVLKQLSRLKVISKYGVGLDNIDQAALEEKNIHLGWTAGVNRRSVAELTLAFMLGLCHNMFSTGFELKQGGWRKEGGIQLQGKTIGVVGCGHVGSEVMRLLQPFECRILVCDILDKSEVCKSLNARQVAFEEMVGLIDVLTLHVPLTSLTHHMVDAKVLSALKPSAFLVNTSRGDVVTQNSLKQALKENKIAGAALDVFHSEPPEDLEFLSLPNLMVTPHIGGNAKEAVSTMATSAIGHLVEFFDRDVSEE